jgi:hypothetical protein
MDSQYNDGLHRHLAATSFERSIARAGSATTNHDSAMDADNEDQIVLQDEVALEEELPRSDQKVLTWSGVSYVIRPGYKNNSDFSGGRTPAWFKIFSAPGCSGENTAKAAAVREQALLAAVKGDYAVKFLKLVCLPNEKQCIITEAGKGSLQDRVGELVRAGRLTAVVKMDLCAQVWNRPDCLKLYLYIYSAHEFGLLLRAHEPSLSLSLIYI